MNGMTPGIFKEVVPSFSREAILHILKKNIGYDDYAEFFPFAISYQNICDEIMKLKPQENKQQSSV